MKHNVQHGHPENASILSESASDYVWIKTVYCLKSKFYNYEQTKYLVNPKENINLSGLSGTEIAHIDWELNRLADLTAAQISALSHKDTPWLVAKEKEIMDYEHVFYRPDETSVREYEPL